MRLSASRQTDGQTGSDVHIPPSLCRPLLSSPTHPLESAAAPTEWIPCMPPRPRLQYALWNTQTQTHTHTRTGTMSYCCGALLNAPQWNAKQPRTHSLTDTPTDTLRSSSNPKTNTGSGHTLNQSSQATSTGVCVLCRLEFYTVTMPYNNAVALWLMQFTGNFTFPTFYKVGHSSFLFRLLRVLQKKPKNCDGGEA